MGAVPGCEGDLCGGGGDGDGLVCGGAVVGVPDEGSRVEVAEAGGGDDAVYNPV